MNYTRAEVLEFIETEDVRFVRLVFCDAFGKPKNIAIMPDELPRAFDSGISFDASSIPGFRDETKSDLLLFPIPATLTSLPWRSYQGKVASMFCEIRYPDGRVYEKDSRAILSAAVAFARTHGITVNFGAEYEFYLFKRDAQGEPTKLPFDNARYMDAAPEDKGEDIRREICLSLLDIGIRPESAHHEAGPGQNEIDFRYSDAMTAADNAVNFIGVVKSAADQNGLYADFSPKPLPDREGNGLHINMSVVSSDGADKTAPFMAGVLAHIREISAFLNPTEDSYKRLGEMKAPRYITWSPENRSQLIRIPAAKGEYRRIELRSPDPTANPYLAYALLIHAGLDGIINDLPLQESTDINLYTADKSVTDKLDTLPGSLPEAVRLAEEFDLVRSGRVDVVLAGGTESAVNGFTNISFGVLQALSSKWADTPEKASRPFDKDRDGFVMGEGSTILILEEYEHAKARGAKIYAEVAGYGATTDGYHLTAPNPDGVQGSRAMTLAMEDAGVKPEDVVYYNAHGTSTHKNDSGETQMLKNAFGDAAYKLHISSTKSMTGHCLGNAGSLEAFVCVKAIEDNFIPPTINLDNPDVEGGCDLDYTPNKGLAIDVPVAMSGNFGFGGHNGILVFKRVTE